MSNKINGLSGSPAAPIGAGRPTEQTRDPVTGGGLPAGSVVSGGDVHITDSASQLASLEQTLRSLPAVDPVRVAQLQTAIEQGTYTVQPQHLADQLLQLEKALGQMTEG
jgi:negative regulator of flagellin synthesis FlgM